LELKIIYLKKNTNESIIGYDTRNANEKLERKAENINIGILNAST